MSDRDPHDNEPTFVRITNAMVWTKLGELEKKLDALSDYPETRKRVRGLELRFYGILAGVVGALTYIVASAGPVG